MITNDSLNPHFTGSEFLIEHSKRKRYPKNSVIIQPSDEPNTLFYIIKGSASVSIQDEDSREIIVAFLNAGSFIGEIGFFFPDTPREATVRARTDCELALIYYDDFRELLKGHPELLFAIDKQLARRLNAATRKVKNLAFLDVTGRVAATLLDLCKQPDAMTHPDGMQIKVTRQEIGRIVGCSREMVGRVIKNLEEDGILEASGKTMVIYGVR